MPSDARPLVWLVRHGETTWNREGIWQGHRDVSLSDVGIAQANQLARRFLADPPARVVSSDLRRALETAETVARAVGRTVATDRDFREQALGAWEGLTNAEIAARESEFERRFHGRDPDFRPPGGETRAELRGRAWRAFLAHAAPGSPGPLLIVAHGGVVSSIVYEVLGWPVQAPQTFHLPNVGVTTLVFTEGAWRVRDLCDTSHAPAARGGPFGIP